jgi:hypothetical protein
MSYESQSISYRYKHFPLHSGVTMLCISVDEPDIASLAGDRQLWAKFVANAIKKHGQGKTLGILKIGNQTYVPKPIAGVPSAQWPLTEQFANDRPAEDEENWPLDSGTAL